jgi:diguanylate cyclase (GGDEF)-like protein
MPPAPLPRNEVERLAALRSYDALERSCEAHFDRIVKLAARIAGTPVAAVSLLDAERVSFPARLGLDVAEAPREVTFCAHGLLSPGQPLLVDDLARDARFADNPLVTGAPRFRAYAGFPLINVDGFALGMLCVLDQVPRATTPEQQQALMVLAEAVATALDLRRALRQAQHLAMTDPLTGLPNRAALLEALDRTIARQRRHGDPFALLTFDLDGFKHVNDMMGHLAGDAVLREVAVTLEACLRREDMSARLGGDEFAVLLTGGMPDGHAVAERLQAALAAAMAGSGWPVTASVGAATFHAPPADVNAALSIADELMYGAKRGGRNRIVSCTIEGEPAARRAASLLPPEGLPSCV